MNYISARMISDAVDKQFALAKSLFDDLERNTRDEPGITRATYGESETKAHEIVARHAKAIGLAVSHDSAMNTYMTLAGSDSRARKVMVGSHLDSIPHGGNFDGAAGVVSGLVAAAAIKSLGILARNDFEVMATRAEESVWFEISYIGSRAALGRLPESALAARRIDTGLSLAEHIKMCGGNPDAITNQMPHLLRDQIEAFVEVHIEQAPSLEESGYPIAICTGIPGNFRYANAEIRGERAHVGLPRRFRHDCVMAASDLASALDRIWADADLAGQPMAVTLGRFHTDAKSHALTVVPGEFSFSLDVRSPNAKFLAEVEKKFELVIAEIERLRGVKFELGIRASVAPGIMDPAIVAGFEKAICELGVQATRLSSPASHDAAAFSAAGVPTGMLFIRNQNGSHNPDEKMRIEDLIEATKVLTLWFVSQGDMRSE